MAGVTRKRRDGRWLARWRDPGGRQRKKISSVAPMPSSGSTSSSRRCIAASTWIHVPAGDSVTQVAESLGGWADSSQGVHCHPIPEHPACARATGLWRVALGRLRPSDIQEWVTRFIRTDLRRQLRQCHRVLLSRSTSPSADQRIGSIQPGHQSPRARRAEPRFLSPSRGHGADACCGQRRPRIAVLAWCGLRFGELAALGCATSISSERGFHVKRSVTEVCGGLWLVGPKSTTAARSVPAHAKRDCCETKTWQGHDDPLFTAPDGGVLRLSNWRRRVFDRARDASDARDITPTRFRHTAASLAITCRRQRQSRPTHARACVCCHDPRRIRGPIHATTSTASPQPRRDAPRGTTPRTCPC